MACMMQAYLLFLAILAVLKPYGSLRRRFAVSLAQVKVQVIYLWSKSRRVDFAPRARQMNFCWDAARIVLESAKVAKTAPPALYEATVYLENRIPGLDCLPFYQLMFQCIFTARVDLFRCSADLFVLFAAQELVNHVQM